MRIDIKQEVCDKLIELMEREGTNWTKPWVSSGAGTHRNARSGKPYRGVNAFLTGLHATSQGYDSPYWSTYDAWKALGYQVAKGQKALRIVFWRPIEVGEPDESGERRKVPFMRHYNVFNACQLTEEYAAESVPVPSVAETHEAAQRLVDAVPADVRFGGDRACYIPSEDRVLVPRMDQFASTEGFYDTVFHELGHWTGHASRLDRNLKNWFGSPEYAFEELVAETCSALLCAATGLSPEPRADHAKYLNNWLRGLREHPEAVSRAFGQAQKAADFLEAFSQEQELEEAA